MLPRAGSVLTCTLKLSSQSVASTVILVSDIAFIGIDMGSSTSARPNALVSSVVSTDGGLTYSCSIDLPTTPTTDYRVAATVSGVTVAFSDFQLFGSPTAASELNCFSTLSPAGFVQVLENVTCSITVKDDHGLSTGLASDFIVETDGESALTALTTYNKGATFNFTVMAPNTSEPFFIIKAFAGAAGFRGDYANFSLICWFLS
jgi:hypothetical protein